jgi:hypothetical protein
LEPATSPLPPEQTPLSKIRQLWILAAVAYGSMFIVILLAIWTYLHFWTVRERPEDTTLVSVGSAWLPVYPGAITEDSTSTKHDRATESIFRFRSKDPAAKVLDFYAPSLRTAHFRNYTSRRTGTGGMVQAMGSGRDSTIVISARPSSSGSEVQITTLDR